MNTSSFSIIFSINAQCTGNRTQQLAFSIHFFTFISIYFWRRLIKVKINQTVNYCLTNGYISGKSKTTNTIALVTRNRITSGIEQQANCSLLLRPSNRLVPTVFPLTRTRKTETKITTMSYAWIQWPLPLNELWRFS